MMRLTPVAAAVAILALTLAGPARRHDVSIEGLRYKPASVEIRAGDIVVWTNNDDRDHTVVAADGSFHSGNIGAGQTWERTFDKAGTFAYGCNYHPRMKGVVVVAGN